MKEDVNHNMFCENTTQFGPAGSVVTNQSKLNSNLIKLIKTTLSQKFTFCHYLLIVMLVESQRKLRSQQTFLELQLCF